MTSPVSGVLGTAPSGGKPVRLTRLGTEGNAGMNLRAGGTVGSGSVGASVRANGPPVATIQTAATAKAPPTITPHRRLAATPTAGGTLSWSRVSMGKLDMRSPEGSGCWRGPRITSRGVVFSGTRYRGAWHLG